VVVLEWVADRVDNTGTQVHRIELSDRMEILEVVVEQMEEL